MDQKPHMIDQKGLKMYKKRAKNRVFFYLKYLLFSGIRGYPPPPKRKKSRYNILRPPKDTYKWIFTSGRLMEMWAQFEIVILIFGHGRLVSY